MTGVVLVNGAEVGVVIEVYMDSLCWSLLLVGFGGSVCLEVGGKTTKAAGLVNPAASEEEVI
jgi:hypothetical protein